MNKQFFPRIFAKVFGLILLYYLEKHKEFHKLNSGCESIFCDREMESENRVDDGLRGKSTSRDGGYGWIVCCGTFIVNFVVFGIHNSFGVVYVNLLDELKLGAMQTGKQRVHLAERPCRYAEVTDP